MSTALVPLHETPQWQKTLQVGLICMAHHHRLGEIERRIADRIREVALEMGAQEIDGILWLGGGPEDFERAMERLRA